MEKMQIEISWASLWRVLLMIVFVALVLYLRNVVAIIFLAIFISTALNGIVSRLEKTFRLPRILATILVFLAALTLIAFVIYTIVPIAIVELSNLINNFQGSLTQIFGKDIADKLSDFVAPGLNNLANILLSGSASFLDIIGQFVGSALYFLSVLVISFYLTLSRDGVRDFLKAIFPINLENKVLALYDKARHKIGRWFNAELLLMIIVGSAVFTGLWLLDVKYSLMLAITAGLLELVPVVGPVFAGALAIIIAANDSFATGIYVFLLFLAVQQIESNVLVPVLLKKAIDVHPVVILVSLLAGLHLAGFVGMILAVPAAVVGQELMDDWITKKSSKNEE